MSIPVVAPLPCSPRNILLIQLGDIGDVVLTVPSIRAVKEAFPEALVSVLVFKPFGLLLATDPFLHDVIETARVRGSLLRRLREFVTFARYLHQKRYDLTIDLRTGDRGALLSFVTGASVRVGRHAGQQQFWHKILFTDVIHDLKAAPPPVHPGADQSLRILRELGIHTKDSIPRLYISPDVRQAVVALLQKAGVPPGSQFVSVNPFSRWKYKEWNNGKWGEVIDRLWETHRIPAVLIGSPEEAAGCQEIVAGRAERTFNLAGKTTLSELAAVISVSSLHLGVDSAAPHIAAALGTPTVTIHGPTDWRGWRIVDEHNSVVSPEMDCLPCNKMGCDNTGLSRCLEQMQVGPVVLAADKILSNSNQTVR